MNTRGLHQLQKQKISSSSKLKSETPSFPFESVLSKTYRHAIITLLQMPLIWKKPSGIIEQLNFEVGESQRMWKSETTGDKRKGDKRVTHFESKRSDIKSTSREGFQSHCFITLPEQYPQNNRFNNRTMSMWTASKSEGLYAFLQRCNNIKISRY